MGAEKRRNRLSRSHVVSQWLVRGMRWRALVFGFQFCHWVTLGDSCGPLCLVILSAPYRFAAKAKGHVT